MGDTCFPVSLYLSVKTIMGLQEAKWQVSKWEGIILCCLQKVEYLFGVSGNPRKWASPTPRSETWVEGRDSCTHGTALAAGQAPAMLVKTGLTTRLARVASSLWLLLCQIHTLHVNGNLTLSSGAERTRLSLLEGGAALWLEVTLNVGWVYNVYGDKTECENNRTALPQLSWCSMWDSPASHRFLFQVISCYL